MTWSRQLVFVLCLFWGAHGLAHAQPEHDEPRGKLLYETHCNACHTSEIHWREQKLAADWESLRFQVRRWQASIGLAWSEEEITDVTRYLNSTHYGFPVSDQERLSQEEKPIQVLRQHPN